MFDGLWNGMFSKNEILIYQAKANINVNILFGKSTYLLDSSVRKENAGKG